MKLTRVKYNSDIDLANNLYGKAKRKDEFGISFGSVDTFENLQRFIDLYEDKIFLLNDSAHDLSMYIMVYINSEKKVATFFDATSNSFKKWKNDGIKITSFSDVDCIDLIDKRLGIKRKENA